jgi:hypothetical protein
MATEERILAKMEQLKKEQLEKEAEEAIEREAKKRLDELALVSETEKLEQAIFWGDINTIREFAGMKQVSRYPKGFPYPPGVYVDTTSWTGGSKIRGLAVQARQFLDRREAEQKKAAEEEEQRNKLAKEAFDKAQKEAMLAEKSLDDIVCSIERTKADEEWRNSPEGRKKQRELATLGCRPPYKNESPIWPKVKVPY